MKPKHFGREAGPPTRGLNRLLLYASSPDSTGVEEVTLDEFAWIFGVPTATIREWIKDKDLPDYTDDAGCQLFDLREVLAWVQSVYAGELPWP